jgi:hypothetical protein
VVEYAINRGESRLSPESSGNLGLIPASEGHCLLFFQDFPSLA